MNKQRVYVIMHNGKVEAVVKGNLVSWINKYMEGRLIEMWARKAKTMRQAHNRLDAMDMEAVERDLEVCK